MTDHSGNATNMHHHIPDATKMVTREEREELRRRLDGTYRLYGYALEFRMPMVLRLFDTIDALEAENARLRATMRHWECEIGGTTCEARAKLVERAEQAERERDALREIARHLEMELNEAGVYLSGEFAELVDAALGEER